MDFMTGLPISTDWKGDSYNVILVIVVCLIQMVHYKPIKITINAPGLTEVIMDMVVWHHGLPNSIMTDKGFLFNSKFWSLLCYFLDIKHKLSTMFYPQTDRQTERQNSSIQAYLWAFVNFEQNNWARLLPMAKFVYNNAKNTSTGHTFFKFNCNYHFCVFFKEDTNLYSKLKIAKRLSSKLRKLMTVCRKNLYHV